MKGNATVNHSISSSFDPGKQICIGCCTEHKIVSKAPVVFLFSDQNFVPTLAAENTSCINIVSVENASLAELVDTAREMLMHVKFSEGTQMMFGSVSYVP
jgi:hypothetical protein